MQKEMRSVATVVHRWVLLHHQRSVHVAAPPPCRARGSAGDAVRPSRPRSRHLRWVRAPSSCAGAGPSRECFSWVVSG